SAWCGYTSAQIARSVPVTCPLDSAARYATASATAVTGVHVRGSTSGIAARLAGVSIVLGSTALTVTPRLRVSWASACTKAVTPPLDAGLAMEPARGGHPAPAAAR